VAGSIEIVCGPMFSGKSEELIRRLKRVEIAGYSPLVIKPQIDIRYSYCDVVSHSGVTQAARTVAEARDILELYSCEEVVAIDEVQFFDEEIIEVVRYLRNDGVRVILAGLDTDFRGEPFGQVGGLLAVANQVDKLKAICHSCRGFNADMTQRLVDGKPASKDASIISIGGLESYEARCLNCYDPPRLINEQLSLF